MSRTDADEAIIDKVLEEISSMLIEFETGDRICDFSEKSEKLLATIVRVLGQPIENAPTDGTAVLVYAPPYASLPEIITTCSYHPDAGWCVCELRYVTRWLPLPKGGLNA